MNRSIRTRKGIACFFLALLAVEGLLPSVAWALTSGPAQPETKQFAQASTNDMVDLFSGDFKYNIPLLDVDGYPVNLNYKSGAGVDDESSWVGLGWNLNVGAITRQLRGIADDSYGDEVKVENYMKPKITYGGMATVRGEIFGSGLGGSISVGVSNDNYNGVGASVGVNAGLSLVKSMGSSLTPGLNVGITSSTSDGVTVTPSLSLNMLSDKANHITTTMTVANAAYNTREGLKTLQLGASFSNSQSIQECVELYHDSKEITKEGGTKGLNVIGSAISFNTPVFYPKTNIPFKTNSFTFSLDVGVAGEGAYGGLGGTGYKTVRQVASEKMTNKSYGFMYAEKGKDVPDALMDFMREKDNPITPDLKNLALPIVTPDLFSYTGQAGTGQFRLYRHSAGVFFDNATAETTDNSSASVEVGLGALGHGGIGTYKQNLLSTNGKWTNGNAFLKQGDFAGTNSADEEAAYFKQIGEKRLEDPNFLDRVLGENAVSVPLDKKTALGTLTTADKKTNSPSNIPYKKDGRQVRRTSIMALTAEQAALAAIDKQILNYPFNQYGNFTPAPCNSVTVTKEKRVNDFRKAKHISEVSVVGDDGNRMVYGLPTYNKKQQEYTFATADAPDLTTNLVPIHTDAQGNIDHRALKGGKSLTDEYYHSEEQPSYATSYLLTAVLSSDYEDLTGDGISDDDRGTAIKFNYSKVQGDYGWRSPAAPGQAIFNRGLNADPDDNKASFVYGEKELWYLHSIESKTKIAYFITEDREDGYGFDLMGNIQSSLKAPKQKRLREIILYSKADLTTPIKKVELDYDYKLCPGVPNAKDKEGKLMLKMLHFEYGSSSKASANPYQFFYANNPAFAWLSSDRWGTFKPQSDNAADGFSQMRNDEFPYTTRKPATAASDASAWQLSSITLPTGGQIDVGYEADDYTYVQNKQASQLYQVKRMINGDGSPTIDFINAKGVEIDMPGSADATTTSAFISKYLNGEQYMYARFFINLTDQISLTSDDAMDFVTCYGKVKSASVSNGVARIIFEDDTEGNVSVNPIVSAAWQKMRLEYPRYAYPGYNNRINDDRPVTAVLSALLNAVKTLGELTRNFNQRANKKGFAGTVNLAKSFVRLTKTDGAKIGGGVRVKKIQLSDVWNSMVPDNQAAATYGQAYEYTMRDEQGNVVLDQNKNPVSSGVASNEPSLGGDENPLHTTMRYQQNVTWGLTNYFYLEQPMGESLFPAPSVGYRMVTVRNLGADGNVDADNKTGWITSEFYTAKEFPVVVTQTPLDKYLHKPVSWSTFFGGSSIYELAMSQGYAITLNDMHGQPRKIIVRDQSGAEISSTEYVYNTTEEGGTQRLSNIVDVVDNTGQITKDQVIGREVEVYTDMRNAELFDSGKSLNFGFDMLQFGFFVIPIPHWPYAANNDYRSFNSSCVVKTIQYYGLLSQVIKKINGSSIVTTNVLYDKYTGDPVVTATQNEFNDNVYKTVIPAYWMNNHMGMAYHNLGMLMKTFQTNGSGVIYPNYVPYVQDGDEMVDVSSGERVWVVNSPTSANAASAFRLIDANGRIEKDFRGDVVVCRSGYRNQLTAPATVMATLQNPIENNRLAVLNNEDLTRLKVLNATSVLYTTGWGQPADCNAKTCPTGYNDDGHGGCVWKATPSPALFNLVQGDKDTKYNDRGAFFFDDAHPKNQFATSTASFWTGCNDGCGRLVEEGIWLDGLPDGRWFGVEKVITIPTTGNYYIGYASDNRMHLYIDGVSLDQFNGSSISSFEAWHIRQHLLTAGKHILRFDAVNGESKKAVAVEVYGSTLGVLENGTDGNTIKSQRIFHSSSLIGDKNALIFYTDQDGTILKQNYSCSNGQPMDITNGEFTCGPSRPQSACPDGFTPSADGQACIPNNSSVDTDPDFTLAQGNQQTFYSVQGAIFHDANGNEGTRISNNPFWGASNCTTPTLGRTANVAKIAVPQTNASSIPSDSDGTAVKKLSVLSASPGFCGRLNSTGFWFKGAFDNQWIGVNNCLKVPASKTYYIGFGADNRIRIYIDGVLLKQDLSGGSGIFLDWKMHPIYLTMGEHILSIEGFNDAGSHSVGAEIYNNTEDELLNGQVNTIFSTSDLLDGKDHDLYTKNTSDIITRRKFNCPSGTLNICEDPIGCPAIPNGIVLNPFLTGYLGNWLPYQQNEWLSARSGQELVKNNTIGADTRHNGYLPSFLPYWWYNNGAWGTSNNQNWVTGTTITLYDKQEQEVESKNALNIYGAARYGFKSTLPVAVGANMRQREIFYDGFEDYKFNELCITNTPVCEPDGFNIRKVLGDNYQTRLNTSDAHSGNYSLSLSSDLTLTTYAFSNEHKPGIYLSNNQFGEYFRQTPAWLGLRGFCPVNGRDYVFSVWVKDNGAANVTPGVKLTVNNQQLTLTRKATVEGWKLMEVTIGKDLLGTADMTNVTITLSGGAGMYIDDIRIFPFDGQMKTYAYDERTQRVMAELDENNYATFYEYDDEGTLVRVKKETERGIMTIKESRSALRRVTFR